MPPTRLRPSLRRKGPLARSATRVGIVRALLRRVAVEHLLTDNGRQFCGRELHHPFELYLAISQVRHRRPEVRSPETNGFCERFHRTLKEESFAVAFRKSFYESVEQLQAALDQYLHFYNRERAHQGYRTPGRTAYQAFLNGVGKLQENSLTEEKTKCLRSESPELKSIRQSTPKCPRNSR